MASTKSKVVIASIAVLLLAIGGTTVLLRNRSSSVHVNTIVFKANSIFTEAELAKVIASKVGEPVDQGKIDHDVIAIQKVYREAGYGNIAVRAVQETDKSAGQSSVKFVVEEPRPK